MSSPSDIPRRSSGASSNNNNNNNDDDDDGEGESSLSIRNNPYGLTTRSDLLVVGGPPSSPSPLALRASNSPSSKRRKSRLIKLPPDLRMLEYVSHCDSNLICLICHCPFDSPIRLVCDHYFCKECLDHAWDAQQSSQKTCPTCRHKINTPNDSALPVPRILETMLNELKVKCPNTRCGCNWVDQRANVNDHVMLYCEYTMVECPLYECKFPVRQKDFHKGCLHLTVSCEYCNTSLMKVDLEEHQRTNCPNRETHCPQCSEELLRLELKSHVKDVCPATVVPCTGSIVGCSFTAERAMVVQHEVSCPMATMAPFFRDQQDRIERNEAKMEPLIRKVGILEDGLSNIIETLYPSSNNNDSSFPVTNPLDPNNPDTFTPSSTMPTPDFRLPPASFPPVPPTEQSHTPITNPTQPPFDSNIHHLLTLHESLRDEVSRIANAITDLEGRTSMMIINENQRVKDEMLHANAAIHSIRAQVLWLMSARLQQRTSSSSGSAAGRSGGGSSSTGTNGSGASTQGGGTRGSGTLQLPMRRLSDSTRQDTKL